MTETGVTALEAQKTEPVTATIDWRDGTTPVSTRFDDVYFSTDGGLAESRAVFLDGCGLPPQEFHPGCFTVVETGFGTGLNFLALLERWRLAPWADRLRFLSIEAYPLSAHDMEAALGVWEELGAARDELLTQYPPLHPGWHRLRFEPRLALDLIIGEAAESLSAMATATPAPGSGVHAWFLDGFSPANNPDMWGEPVLSQTGRLSAPGARLATFTVARDVRDSLTRAGFALEKKSGFGRKRHRLEGLFTGRPPSATS